MESKPNVLVFTSFYLPGYKGGGPIKTVASLVGRLADRFNFYIYTTDRDLGDNAPYKGVLVGKWNLNNCAAVFYSKGGRRRALGVVREMQSDKYSLVYLNSFFSPYFTILPLLCRRFMRSARKPVVLAPRGEFSNGAIGIKRFKKEIFLRLGGVLGLWRGVQWQATSEGEREDIVRALGVSEKSIRIVGNIVPPSSMPIDLKVLASEKGDVLRICYLSRVAEIKNLDFALRVLSRVKQKVDFDIYGPCEDRDYWGECLSLVEKLPGNVRVNYRGGVPNSEVRSVISRYNLFFVPSKGENFGHVFVEAFAAGVPVLVSDQTPWRSLESKGVGWDVALSNEDGFVTAIELVANSSMDVRLRWQRACIEFAELLSLDDGAEKATCDLFLAALGDFK